MTDSTHLPPIPDDPEGFSEFVRTIREIAADHRAHRDDVHEFARMMFTTFWECMEEEGVNLDAAITMSRILFEKDRELDAERGIVSGLSRDFFKEGWTAAVDMAHEILGAAARLVQLNTEGSPVPKPYDREEHLAERAIIDTIAMTCEEKATSDMQE